MRKTTYVIIMLFVFVGLLGTSIWCRVVGMEGDPERARTLLLDEGYSNISVGSADAWNCDKEDSVSNDFTATAPGGRLRSGTICCGYEACSKGCTIRWSK